MTTSGNGPLDLRAIKVARVRRLTDPLGAAGFRSTRDRVGRESRVRSWLFAVVVGSYLAITGGLIITDQLHEAPIPETSSSVVSVVRLKPDPAPHTRTKSS